MTLLVLAALAVAKPALDELSMSRDPATAAADLALEIAEAKPRQLPALHAMHASALASAAERLEFRQTHPTWLTELAASQATSAELDTNGRYALTRSMTLKQLETWSTSNREQLGPLELEAMESIEGSCALTTRTAAEWTARQAWSEAALAHERALSWTCEAAPATSSALAAAAFLAEYDAAGHPGDHQGAVFRALSTQLASLGAERSDKLGAAVVRLPLMLDGLREPAAVRSETEAYLSQHPTDALTAALYASLLEQMDGPVATTEEAFRTARDADSTSIQARLVLAGFYLRQAETLLESVDEDQTSAPESEAIDTLFRKAAPELTAAHELDPTNLTALRGLVRVHGMLGEVDKLASYQLILDGLRR